MNPIDTYRYAFQQLLAQGKTPLEALCEFDREKWNAAMNEEIMQGGDSMLLDYAALAGREGRDEKDLEQAVELWLAGWTSELPDHYNTPEAQERAKRDIWSRCAVMSWYWRRPPRRAGKPGRRYLSTNQAYNALERERDDAGSGS